MSLKEGKGLKIKKKKKKKKKINQSYREKSRSTIVLQKRLKNSRVKKFSGDGKRTYKKCKELPLLVSGPDQKDRDTFPHTL